MSEFLIIGAGVYGAATAWELARRGAQVRVIEGRGVASAASGGPGRRGVRAAMRDHRELPLMRLAYERWPSLHEEIGGVSTFERTGHLTFIERIADLEAAPARVALQCRHGIASRLIGRGELLEIEPGVGEAVCAAIHCERDGVADHTATTRGFARAAVEAGARIDEGDAVVALERDGMRITAVITTGGERIPVGRECLLLANSGTDGLLRSAFDLDLPVWNTCPQVVLTRPPEPVPIRHLIGHCSRTVAIKAEPGGQVMVSGGYRGRWDPERETGEALPEAVRDNLAQAAAVFPDLAGAEVVAAVADHLESMSLDGVPIIDRPGAGSNLLFATGWSGHGWAIAPAVSRLIAGWVLDGRRPELLAPFSLARFDAPEIRS